MRTAIIASIAAVVVYFAVDLFVIPHLRWVPNEVVKAVHPVGLNGAAK